MSPAGGALVAYLHRLFGSRSAHVAHASLEQAPDKQV